MGKQKQGRLEQGGQRLGGQHPGGQRLGGQEPPVWQKEPQEGQESESFGLRTYLVGGMG